MVIKDVDQFACPKPIDNAVHIHAGSLLGSRPTLPERWACDNKIIFRSGTSCAVVGVAKSF